MATQKLLEITQTRLNDLFDKSNIVTGDDYERKYGGGNTYDGFEIKTDITISSGQTLKDFENIVVNPTTKSITIKNGGTIDNCIITLNVFYLDGQSYCNSIISNSDSGIGNIIDCSITLNDYSEFYNNGGSINGGNIILNGNSAFYCVGNITDGNITLNGNSIFNNGHKGNGNIIGGSITLNDYSEFYNNGYIYECNINGCTITLNDNSWIFNNYSRTNNINNCTIILNGNSEIDNDSGGEISNSYIFLYNKAIFQNFCVYASDEYVYRGILTDTYIFAFDSCEIWNTYDGKSGTFNNTFILKFSDNCIIDKTIDDYIVLSTKKISDLNNQIKELEKYIENLKSIIEQLKNTNDNITVKDNTLGKLLLLNYLTQKDNSGVL